MRLEKEPARLLKSPGGVYNLQNEMEGGVIAAKHIALVGQAREVAHMKRMNRWIGWLFCLLSAVLAMATLSSAAEAPAMLVGRIYHIEGDLLRYVPEEKDWVAAVQDAPFGAGDTLFSGSSGMAELIIPNGVWIRTGNGTQIQFIALDSDLAEMDVASGTARFYGKGQAAVKVTSAFGYVQADSGTIFDFYVGENSVEVVAIKGTVSFVHTTTGGRYDVASGAASVLADPEQVSSGDGTVDPEWNRWNMERENFWLARAEVKGPSAEYLPPELRSDAYALEENGSWETIYYEGQERRCWRPTRVAVGWSPFTVGRWTDWYGDQTWIPAEPFGYVTHHYGNWIYARNHWYWAPPVVRVGIGLPLLDIGLFWFPGRVAWIHSGVYVGWVPLAPRETYYCRRPWGGPHTVVVNNININRININLGSHAYVDRAIIVNRDHFYGRDNYRNVRVTNINRTTIINNYRMAPVVGSNVVRNYSTDRQRFNFTNVPVREKPHSTVVNRIRDNERVIREGRIENAPVLRERLKEIPAGRINREARVEQPRGATPVVPANEVNRPKAELKLPEREIKGGGRGAPPPEPGRTPAPAGRVTPPAPVQPDRTAPRGERATPATPPQPGQPMRPADGGTPARTAPAAPRTERVIPARPAQPEKPADRAAPARPASPVWGTPGTGQVEPARPLPPEPAAQRPERVVPVRPAQPEPPGRPVDRVAPARPAPQTQPATPTERVIPARPAPAEPVAPRPERVVPARPAQPEQPARPAERVTPARPAPQTQPATPTERVIPARPATPEPVAPRSERVAPAGPVPQPAMPAERAIPARPSSPVQPAMPAERMAPTRPAPAEPVRPEQPEPREGSGRQQTDGPHRAVPERK